MKKEAKETTEQTIEMDTYYVTAPVTFMDALNKLSVACEYKDDKSGRDIKFEAVDCMPYLAAYGLVHLPAGMFYDGEEYAQWMRDDGVDGAIDNFLWKMSERAFRTGGVCDEAMQKILERLEAGESIPLFNGSLDEPFEL